MRALRDGFARAVTFRVVTTRRSKLERSPPHGSFRLFADTAPRHVERCREQPLTSRRTRGCCRPVRDCDGRDGDARRHRRPAGQGRAGAGLGRGLRRGSIFVLAGGALVLRWFAGGDTHDGEMPHGVAGAGCAPSYYLIGLICIGVARGGRHLGGVRPRRARFSMSIPFLGKGPANRMDRAMRCSASVRVLTWLFFVRRARVSLVAQARMRRRSTPTSRPNERTPAEAGVLLLAIAQRQLTACGACSRLRQRELHLRVADRRRGDFLRAHVLEHHQVVRRVFLGQAGAGPRSRRKPEQPRRSSPQPPERRRSTDAASARGRGSGRTSDGTSAGGRWPMTDAMAGC